MKTVKKIMNLVPLMLFWLMMSVFVWSWIFTFLTDAPRAEKIVLYVECAVPGDTFIAAKLEETPSPSIRMAQVRPFSYSMMSSQGIRNADLYIVSESGMKEYFEWLLPLPENAASLCETHSLNGIPYGIKVYDALTQSGILSNQIAYDTEKAENYYLAFGKQSLHIAGNENAVSDEAVSYAARLFEIE